MDNFVYYTPTKIVFGKGEEKNIGLLIKDKASNVLIHYGSNRIVDNGLLAIVLSSLKENNINYQLLGGVVPNPRLNLVYEGIKIVKENNIDHILAIGGGSVLDSAKAIALGSAIEEDVWDYYYIKRNKPTSCLPISTIITIPAAGSESSNSSVILNDLNGRKIGFASDLIRPYLSIINPEFFYSLKKKDSSAGICDIMIHIFERYFSHTLNNDVVDEMSEGVLRAIIKNALIINKDQNNYAAWSEIGLASTLAHNGLLGLGRSQDWASHQLEHELSAKYDISHGYGLAIIVPAWMKYVYKYNINIFYSFVTRVMKVRNIDNNKENTILRGINKLEVFFKTLGLPIRLSEVGIYEADFSELAHKATLEYYGGKRTLGGIKKLDASDLINILILAK